MAKSAPKAKTSKVMKAAVPKAKAKAKAKGAAKLTKTNLKDQEEETLMQKVRRLAQGTTTAQEAIDAVSKGLTTLDRSKIHGQHVTATNKDSALKAEKEEAVNFACRFVSVMIKIEAFIFNCVA